jgi:crotonobetainyl-CoA:carnitine CoA-transferase CaiB-like acyl-CoA transferase
MLSMLQPGRFWPEFCVAVGRPELAEDERFNDTAKIMKNALEAAHIVAEIIAARPYAEWLDVLGKVEGAWAGVQDAFEVSKDVSMRANGYIAPVIDADGEPQELVANPVQFDETPPTLTRAPQFAEHTDEILRWLGRSDDELIELKISGAVT